MQQSLIKDCASIIQNSANKDSARILLEQYFSVHNNNLKRLQEAYPRTVTGTVFAPACTLPASLPQHNITDSLVPFMLHNPGWNNPQWYHTDMLVSMLTLVERFTHMADSTAKKHLVELLLDNTPVNDTAAKDYQQIVYDFFLFRLDEQALRFYANWTEANKDKMINAAQQYKMKKMQSVLPGSPLPDIQLKDGDENERALAEVVKKNKYTVVLFWSVDCDHCLQELPRLISFYQKYHARGVEIYAVAIDCEKEKWAKFIKEKHLEWINVFEPEDRGDVAGEYMITYTPTLVLGDSAGKILSRYGNLEQIENIIR